MKKIISICTMIMLIVSLSISFAWMLEFTEKVGKNVEITYGENGNELSVAASSLDVKLYVQEDQDFVQIGKNQKDIYNVSDFAPGDVIRYRASIKNKSKNDTNLTFILSNIKISNEDFLDFIYVGVYYATGLEKPYEAPEFKEMKIRDICSGFTGDLNNKFTAKVLENFIVPPTTLDNTINLGFYLRFDINASNSLQNQQFSVGNLNVLIV